MTIDRAKRATRRGNGIRLSSIHREPTLYHGIMNTSKGPVLVGWIQLNQRYPTHKALAAALKSATIVSRKELT